MIPRPNLDCLPVVDLTARLTYSLLSNQQLVELRAVSKFCAWGSLSLWRFVLSVRDTAWLSFHGDLPTADRLVRFGMKVDPVCFCGQPETLLHLFVDCDFSKSVLRWFLDQVHKVILPFELTSSQILFGLTLSARAPLAFSALLGILRHRNCLAGNISRFEHTPVTAEDTLRKVHLSVSCSHAQATLSQLYIRKGMVENGVIGSLTEQDWLHFACDFIT